MVWGMPGFIVRAGLADAVVPLEGIVLELLHEFYRGIYRKGAGRQKHGIGVQPDSGSRGEVDGAELYRQARSALWSVPTGGAEQLPRKKRTHRPRGIALASNDTDAQQGRRLRPQRLVS